MTIQNEPGATIRTSQFYSHVSRDQTLALYGKVRDRATIILSATTAQQIALSFEVEIQPCPPGFIQQNLQDEKSGPCICSVSEYQYLGIERCNLTSMQAYGTRGIWIGYEKNLSESEDSLISSFCTPGFCSVKEDFLLPSTASREELNEIVCNDSRKGVLCGLCKGNFSVHMHSLEFSCKSNKYCEWGWIFYILSELLPVTLIFLVIIIFNIPFTSGAINGFIFHCQAITMFHISASDTIPFDPPAQTLKRISSFIYLAYNLMPFVLDELSFCLWKEATALDVLAFSYVTLVYSFTLVIAVILTLNKCISRCNCRVLKKKKPFSSQSSSLQGSIIHGLTAFLILCYAQCTYVSILLLTSAKVHHKGLDNSSLVVYYNGEITWMSSEHLPYAIPALVFLLLISIPSLLLLIYPLHYKVLSALRLAESRRILWFFNPLERLKPFMDSFQSCFKDEYRFFSGLYFVYRFFIIINMGINNLQDSFIILEAQLAFMLILHAICQPYKKRVHNIIDTLLFSNLIFINAITMYNFYNINSKLEHSTRVSFATCVQTVLMLLPLLVVMMFLMAKIILLCCKKTPDSVKDSDKLIESSSISYGTNR